jgi:hypothetical protein
MTVALVPDVLLTDYVRVPLWAMANGPPARRDDTTDPHEILLAEVAAARESLRALVDRMKIERIEWERRLLNLQHSARLTLEQKEKLRLRRPSSK